MAKTFWYSKFQDSEKNLRQKMNVSPESLKLHQQCEVPG